MAGHARKNFGHMGNPFVHGGNRCCPREGNGFCGGAVWLWYLRVSVLPPEGFRIGAWGELDRWGYQRSAKCGIISGNESEEHYE